MTTSLIAILIPSTLIACGALFARFFRLPSVYALLGCASTVGYTLFLLLANALGYVIPLKLACILALLVLILVDILLVVLLFLRADTNTELVTNGDRRGAFFLFALMAVVGLAGARFIGSDPWSWQHFPLASTIVAGNFPVHSPIDPDSPLYYHYAPSFLAAAFTILTGLPLTIGFAFQPLLGAGGILFFTAAMIRRYRGTSAAIVGAVLALAGSGLVWLKLPELMQIFYGLTGQLPLRTAFGELAHLVGTPLTTSPLVFLGHRSTATGFPLLYGVLFAAALFLDPRDRHQKFPALFLVFLFALGLTLTMELAFVTISIAAVITLFLFVLSRFNRVHAGRMFLLGIGALVPALAVSLIHGGVLSGLFAGGHSSFVFRPSFVVMYDTYGNTISLFSLEFLRDFGLPLLLFPFAIIAAWISRRTEPIWLLCAVLALLHFVIPFLFDYQLIRGEMHRVFYGATSLMAMLAGVFLVENFFSGRPFFLRFIGFLLLASMLVSGVIYLALRLTIPTMRLEPSPLFAPMPAISPAQEDLYSWVRAHTDQSDYFYLRNLTVHFETISDEATVQMRDRILFTTYTGRYTIGPIIYWDYRPEWLEDVKQAELTCRDDLFRKLGVTHLVIETPDRQTWFRARCKSSDWEQVYAFEGMRLPKVYELR